MQTWTFFDRTTWGAGPWDSEPDKVQWTDPATDLVCLAKRNHRGVWCGYVGVTEGHPLYGIYYEEADSKLEHSIHGGLSYSDFCQEGEGIERICHIPEPGQPDRVWWLGFACASGGDVISIAPFIRGLPSEVYRTLDYVQDECASLAQQLSLCPPPPIEPHDTPCC